MDNLQISYPTYYLLIIVIVALLFTMGLYFRDRRLSEGHGWLPYLLSFFRFTAVLGLLFLLLTPLFKNFITEKQNPVVVIARDQSASVGSTTPDTLLTAMDTEIEGLRESLSDKFDVETIIFAENMKLAPSDTLRTQSSNLSAPLEYISEAYEDRNLGAIILVSDGIYNEGKNPLYADVRINAPLYTVALGDTTIRTDLIIKNALHNRIVYLNDKFQVEVDVQAYNSRGAASNLKLFQVLGNNSRLIDTRRVTIDKANFFETYSFELTADRTGNQQYRLELTGISDEVSYVNNQRSIYIDVLDARQKILLVAHAAHPDLKALASVVESNVNYEIDIVFAGNNIPPVDEYDIVIMHNLPSADKPIDNILSRIRQLKKPLWYIAGATTDLVALNKSQDVITIEGARENLNNVTPVLESNFSLFTIDEEFRTRIPRMVPLKSQFGNYVLNAPASPFLYQRIGSVETDYPLMAFAEVNGHKQAVLAGEGIWRWRLVEYAENQSQEVTRELVMKTLQYISLKEDKRPFRAYTDKKFYKENESIIFDAQLYNASFEPINEPEASLTIINSDGESFEFTFSKDNNNYTLDAGRFPEGSYRYTAKTRYNGKELESSGSFTIQSIIKEQYDLTARHDVLYALSKRHNGRMYNPGDISQLRDTILAREDIKPVLFQKVRTDNLLNFKWLLGLFLLLLAVEWFARRYFGYY